MEQKAERKKGSNSLDEMLHVECPFDPSEMTLLLLLNFSCFIWGIFLFFPCNQLVLDEMMELEFVRVESLTNPF
jgi:hypothetical protein